MKEWRFFKLAFCLAMVVLLASVAVRRMSDRPALTPQEVREAVRPPTRTVIPQSRRQPPELMAESTPGPAMEDTGAFEVSREKAEEYLQRHGRDASSLLAGYRALQDTNLLLEASRKFSTDPKVQWAMLTSEILSEADRRAWLDGFKNSSPENSLANYLSAAGYFNAGDQAAALQEVIDAGRKRQFKDYALEAMIDEQELRRFSGQSPFQVMHANGWSGDLLRELAPMKQVANGLAVAYDDYFQTGDSAAAEGLIQLGLGFAHRFDTGEGGRFLISQLVGAAIEIRMLQYLDAGTRYDFLGGLTPGERQEQLQQAKMELREMMPALSAAYGTLTEAEMVSYSDRLKAYGEREALRWLQERTEAAQNK